MKGNSISSHFPSFQAILPSWLFFVKILLSSPVTVCVKGVDVDCIRFFQRRTTSFGLPAEKPLPFLRCGECWASPNGAVAELGNRLPAQHRRCHNSPVGLPEAENKAARPFRGLFCLLIPQLRRLCVKLIPASRVGLHGVKQAKI